MFKNNVFRKMKSIG